ncbi:esterase-like activity of phytase family protein [Prosthecomicrobium pneumaticum]|uniref:Phytase-like domain-containing protein n=1 Tax=Prosthecomicrobium pneumaticum TaxID=81895 RepID=A0A7W9FKB0_9HYPH|nr:esterase-like activity of phytase family protein [Prosthecomicrobium pneumaticum]MBB5752456.1 hypothetical protein [Prosthecomicrobium pneumaticum]
MRGRAAALALLLLASTAGAQEFRPLPLSARPIETFSIGSSATRFGEFEFLGGLVVTARDRDFGGLSGLDFTGDGRLLFVSDLGFWVEARPVRENGRLADLVEGTIAPMLDRTGRPLESKRNADAEGLRIVDGTAYVTFERHHAIAAYSARDPAGSRPRRLGIPKTLGRLKSNSGLESIAAAPADGPLAGALVVIAENSLDADGNHKGAVLSGPRAGAFRVRKTDGYSITDAAYLPNGDLLILERKVPTAISVAMRIRRLPGAIRPGALLDGPVVLEGTMRDEIDNMEGLAVSRMEDGRTRITLVSDDNRSLFQRTLLLEFAWQGAPPLAAPEAGGPPHAPPPRSKPTG